jgi:tRNA wybutosine-synthesizing protein 3
MVLSAALQAGFRESGAIGLTSSNNEPVTPLVAVRSMGLGLESVVGQIDGTDPLCFTQPEILLGLVDIANKRFKENKHRIDRFRKLLATAILASRGTKIKSKSDGSEWEDASGRRERKKMEGLRISEALRQKAGNTSTHGEEINPVD